MTPADNDDPTLRPHITAASVTGLAENPMTPTFSARQIARLFGLSLLDIDPTLVRDVRRAHVEYDRRRRARRRRRRARSQ